ncbi:hypothetical protein OH77DRAFT_529635 [Trametes cingulata]|nr:hypothetical protein OH77DRAFT_529635 [Trametes cingulata]
MSTACRRILLLQIAPRVVPLVVYKAAWRLGRLRGLDLRRAYRGSNPRLAGPEDCPICSQGRIYTCRCRGGMGRGACLEVRASAVSLSTIGEHVLDSLESRVLCLRDATSKPSSIFRMVVVESLDREPEIRPSCGTPRQVKQLRFERTSTLRANARPSLPDRASRRSQMADALRCWGYATRHAYAFRFVLKTTQPAAAPRSATVNQGCGGGRER